MCCLFILSELRGAFRRKGLLQISEVGYADACPACAILDLSREKDVQETTRRAGAGNDLSRERDGQKERERRAVCHTRKRMHSIKHKQPHNPTLARNRFVSYISATFQ